MPLLDLIASNDVLDRAYAWLCERRKGAHPNDDVWNVRRRWHELNPTVQAELRAGRYGFQPTRLVRRSREALEVWGALDALVLKAISLGLTEHLGPRLSPRCFHLAGRGGAKAAVRAALANMAQHGFVFRTDVKSYYASIDHDILLALLGQEVHDPLVLDLVEGAIRRTMDASPELMRTAERRRLTECVECSGADP